MSIKSGVAADNRFNEVLERVKQLTEARDRCTLYSENFWLFTKLIEENMTILASCTVATKEAFNLNHTMNGDFTHLAATGSVSFYRGAYASH